MPKLIFLGGITCSGKDTVADIIAANNDNVGLIQIGKEMRRRHPPEFFRGLCAMPETEKEVMEIFKEQYAQNASKDAIIVVGYPRLETQYEFIKQFPDRTFIILQSGSEIYEQRIMNRFPDNVAARELSLARLTNDRVQWYDLILKLMINEERLYIVPNNDEIEDTVQEVLDLMEWF